MSDYVNHVGEHTYLGEANEWFPYQSEQEYREALGNIEELHRIENSIYDVNYDQWNYRSELSIRYQFYPDGLGFRQYQKYQQLHIQEIIHGLLNSKRDMNSWVSQLKLVTNSLTKMPYNTGWDFQTKSRSKINEKAPNTPKSDDDAHTHLLF
jgi:hypothetical protein